MTWMNQHIGAGGRRVWMGGFNLLPYRQRDARRARRRCFGEWLGAALFGCALVLTVVGWQSFERSRLDEQRISAEHAFAQLAAPLAEQTRLQHEREERGKSAARAAALSEPLTHITDLLDTLSHVSADGVVLQQLRQRVHETELLATSKDPVASAVWLKQLSAVRGVQGTEVADLHPVARAGPGVSANGGGPVEFAARLRWDEPLLKNEKARKTAHVPASAAPRSRETHDARGTR